MRRAFVVPKREALTALPSLKNFQILIILSKAEKKVNVYLAVFIGFYLSG